MAVHVCVRLSSWLEKKSGLFYSLTHIPQISGACSSFSFPFCQITHLPKELSNLTRLHTLLIQDLPIVDPPPPLPSLSTQTLLSYLRFKQASSQPLDAMRVVIVGPQNAGKTSLVCRLRGESNMKVSPTKGLEVHFHHVFGIHIHIMISILICVNNCIL